MVSAAEGCENCGHVAGPHVLVSLCFAEVHEMPDIPVAGIMLCPECDCVTTWSIEGFPAPRMPDDSELAVIRAMVL
jgi:hypothetical protein